MQFYVHLRRIILFRVVPPVIYQHPIGASVNEGDDVSMTCSFTGVASPATTINWLKDGQPLPDSFSPPAQGWRNSSLLFAPTVKAHAGNYVCLVETIGHPSVTSQPAFLYVRGLSFLFLFGFYFIKLSILFQFKQSN